MCIYVYADVEFRSFVYLCVFGLQHLCMPSSCFNLLVAYSFYVFIVFHMEPKGCQGVSAHPTVYTTYQYQAGSQPSSR